MEKVTIHVPRELKERAERYAADQGMSFAELVREGLALALEEPAEDRPVHLDEDVFVKDGVGYHSGEHDVGDFTGEL